MPSASMMNSLFIDVRMLQTGTSSFPDDESYNLVTGLLLSVNQIDSALKYVDLALKNGNVLSINVFTTCVRSCISAGKLDALTSVIEKCKVFIYFFQLPLFSKSKLTLYLLH